MWSYKIMGTVGAVLYVAVLTAGIVINSQPFRDDVADGKFTLPVFVAVMLTYTPTNIAFLAMLAGLVAGCASRVTSGRGKGEAADAVGGSRPTTVLSMIYRTESPFGSVFRSLVVYLGFLAGILVTNTDQFTSTTPEQYVRLAAAVSFFAFVVGYDPTRLTSLLSNVTMPVRGGKKQPAVPEGE